MVYKLTAMDDQLRTKHEFFSLTAEFQLQHMLNYKLYRVLFSIRIERKTFSGHIFYDEQVIRKYVFGNCKLFFIHELLLQLFYYIPSKNERKILSLSLKLLLKIMCFLSY